MKSMILHMYASWINLRCLDCYLSLLKHLNLPEILFSEIHSYFVNLRHQTF